MKDILQVIYGENAVQHVLTGKAIQRAIRGHLLVDKCLGQMMVSDLANDMPEFAMLLAESEEQFSLLLKEQISLESVITSHIFGQINQVLNKHKKKLTDRSKTSHLWLNYREMLEIVRRLIMADRTGS